MAQWRPKGETWPRVIRDKEDNLPVLYTSPDAALKAAKEALESFKFRLMCMG
jgi:hypothetical protein